jgi:hypothetical protein
MRRLFSSVRPINKENNETDRKLTASVGKPMAKTYFKSQVAG